MPAPSGDVGRCDGSAIVVAAGPSYVISGTGWFAAEFAYHEPCLASGQPGVFLSFADGWVTITGLPAQHPVGVPTTATVLAGLNPVITVGPGIVEFANGGYETLAAGAGTAAFAGTGDYSPGVHQCGAGGPLTIDVLASVALVA